MLRIETIFCDDIRQENSGKYIFIGVYSADLVPGALPQALGISLWIRVTGLEAGEHAFKLTLLGPGAESPFVIEDTMLVETEETPSVFVFVSVPTQFVTTGNLTAHMEFDGGDNLFAGSIRVLGTE